MTGADFLQLDPARAPAHGLADWLTGQLRAGVTDGRLPVGSRLPSTRGLAGQLGVSRGVVVEAYQRLVDEGLVGGRRGAGTTVLATTRAAAEPAAAADRPVVEIDLSPGLPDLSAFPRQAWLRAERAALGTATAADLGYTDPRGTPALRAALAGWLTRSRGVRTAPGEIIVVNGVAQGLALLAQVLRARGVEEIGFEDPGSAGTRAQLRRWDLRVRPVPVDEHGLDVEALAGSGLAAVVATPAHQFPTGVVLAADRRRALRAWAGAGGLVVEDDYDAEHRYDRPPVAALQSLAPDGVAHLGSVSKTLAPALRLGWLLAPASLRDELVERKRWSDITSPAPRQLALAHLITSGGFERHLRLVRSRQRQRRDALLDALGRHLPQARVQGVAAGLHLLVTLPELDDDRALADAAREQGVAVHPLSWHRTRPGPPGLVIGYAATTPDRLREAVRRLARLASPAG
jgi:GntR family transcriptional regulator / MocR family aminotransferase